MSTCICLYLAGVSGGCSICSSGGRMAYYEYRGIVYPTRGLMCASRRAHYVELLNQGLNFTQAARAVGVSKRTGKVWRNGRTRSTGRNGAASADWYRHSLDKPKPTGSRYLSQAERITLADYLHAGQSIRAIARRLGRSPSSTGREIRRNTHPANCRYEPYLAHQISHERLKRPKPFRSAIGTLVEHATRFTILLYLPRTPRRRNRAGRHHREKMRRLPKLPRNTPAWSQGAELGLHKESARAWACRSISATGTASSSCMHWGAIQSGLGFVPCCLLGDWCRLVCIIHAFCPGWRPVVEVLVQAPVVSTRTPTGR